MRIVTNVTTTFTVTIVLLTTIFPARYYKYRTLFFFFSASRTSPGFARLAGSTREKRRESNLLARESPFSMSTVVFCQSNKRSDFTSLYILCTDNFLLRPHRTINRRDPRLAIFRPVRSAILTKMKRSSCKIRPAGPSVRESQVEK